LDGARGIAILFVAISHGGFKNIIPGALGVTIFFFVSGYLITSLLLKEQEIHSKVNLINFYMRRMWRLMPALVFYVLLSASATALLLSEIDLLEPLSAIFYISNYYNIYPGYKLVNGAYPFYGVLWSLAIEEHFYLLFTPLIAFIKSPKKLLITIISLIIFPLIERMIIGHFATAEFLENYTYHATDTRIDSIAYGCLLAALGYKRIFNFDSKVIFSIGIFGILASLLYRDEYFRNVFRYSLQGISLYLIFNEIIFSGKMSSMRSILSNGIMVFIGKLSYSMYLYHWFAVIIMMLYVGAAEVKPMWQAGYWMITVSMSLLSYYCIERPTLKLRIKYGSNAQ
jgi:peptidoglycan/LPS O-acetylase OafA/YrhL